MHRNRHDVPLAERHEGAGVRVRHAVAEAREAAGLRVVKGQRPHAGGTVAHPKAGAPHAAARDGRQGKGKGLFAAAHGEGQRRPAAVLDAGGNLAVARNLCAVDGLNHVADLYPRFARGVL